MYKPGLRGLVDLMLLPRALGEIIRRLRFGALFGAACQFVAMLGDGDHRFRTGMLCFRERQPADGALGVHRQACLSTTRPVPGGAGGGALLETSSITLTTACSISCCLRITAI